MVTNSLAPRSRRRCRMSCGGAAWCGGLALIVTALMGVERAGAAQVIVGDHTLEANARNQEIRITITGAEQVAAEDFFAQIGDGGSINGGSNTGPVFQSADILAGTIFDVNNTGATGDPGGSPQGSNSGHPLIWVDGTTTKSGAVSDQGLLVTLLVDTTGVNSGTYPLLLSNVANQLGPFNTTLRNAQGSAIPLAITNGSITVVAPEPATAILLAGGGAMALFTRRRRSRTE